MALFDRSHTGSYSPFIVKIWPYLKPFRRYSASKNGLTLKCGFGVVIENGAVRQTMYDFLLVRQCYYSSILYRLRVI